MTGRDLVGYGQQPPDPRWPNGARIALSFVLNYEEGGERTPLEGDPTSEAFLHEVINAPPKVGRRDLNAESMFEFGSRTGFWRVHRIFTAHSLPLTVYAVGQALERNPAAARAMVDAGWEVASHGWRWIDYGEMQEDEEREHVRRAIVAIERATGSRPVGWYTGRISENTRRLVHVRRRLVRGALRGGRADDERRPPRPDRRPARPRAGARPLPRARALPGARLGDDARGDRAALARAARAVAPGGPLSALCQL